MVRGGKGRGWTRVALHAGTRRTKGRVATEASLDGRERRIYAQVMGPRQFA